MGWFTRRKSSTSREIIPHLFLIASLDGGDKEVQIIGPYSQRTPAEIRREFAVIRLFATRLAAVYSVVGNYSAPEVLKEFRFCFDVLQNFLTGSIPQTDIELTAAAITLATRLDKVAEAAGSATYHEHAIVADIWAREGQYVSQRMSEFAKAHKPGESTEFLTLFMTDYFHPSETAPVLSTVKFNVDRITSTVLSLLTDVRLVSGR